VSKFWGTCQNEEDLDEKKWRGWKHLLNHLTIIAALWSAIWLFAVRFNIWNLNFSERGAVFGAGYTDINVQIGAYHLYCWIIAMALIAFLVTIFIRNFKPKVILAGSAIAIWFLVWLIAVIIRPSLIQSYSVSPNELSMEKPYILRNIEFTRKAYGLTNIAEQDFPVEENITPEAVNDPTNDNTLANIRFWDWRVLQSNADQRQSFRMYYRFPDVDVVRYKIDERIVQMMASSRELNQNLLDPRARTWQNERLVYTHGYGICMNPVNTVTTDGQPDYWVKNIPPETRFSALAISRPEIYYGELTRERVYTGTIHEEFDFPKGETNATCHYQGTGGITLSSFLRKLAFAIQFDGLRLLTASEFNASSRILFRRSLEERVKTVAPFLFYDNDPYQVIADGKIWFIWDAYTTTNNFPYSERYEDFNYIRNSVKVVMDAYNGKVRFYVFDPDDPVIQTWQKIFPDLFSPKSELPPALLEHVRYPEDLMRIQAKMYANYHMNDAVVFYNREDAWDIAKEVHAGNIQEILPYYVVITLPGEKEDEFCQILPFTPRTVDPDNPKHNMVAWMAARCDGNHYGKLLVYRFSKDKLIMGPMQIEIRINQDERISKDFTLWSQKGSTVIQGNLLTIPLSDHRFMYVQPIYLQAEAGKMPELKRLVVASNTKLGYGPTFEAALADLLGQNRLAMTTITGTVVDSTVSDKELIKLVSEHFYSWLTLTGEGKLVEAAQHLEALKAILEHSSE